MFKKEREKVTKEMVETFGKDLVYSNVKEDCSLGYILGKIAGSIFIQVLSILTIIAIFYVFIISTQSF